MPRKIVLVVEDNYDNRMIYSEILRHGGYDVVEAKDGVDGVEQARRHIPDLILMDLSMPRLDGWDATGQLKADPATAHIPVCALSAHVPTNGDFARVEQVGFCGYLTKPVEPKQVLRQTEAWIGPALSPGEGEDS